MKTNKHISKKEFKGLLILGLLASVFAFSSLAFTSINAFNESVAEEQMRLGLEANGYSVFEFYSFVRGSFFPLFCILSLFIFVALLKTKIFAVSSLLTLLNFSMFIYEIYLRRGIFFDESFANFGFIEKLFIIGNIFDYLTFLIVSILLFWQISILLRMLIKTSQRKNVLP